MGRSFERSSSLSETKKYRKFTPAQKLELVLASLRGDRSVAEICREHEISETLLRRWREQLLDAGAERFAGAQERSAHAELRKKIAELERALGRKTYELEIAGKLLRDWE
jgi:transposase